MLQIKGEKLSYSINEAGKTVYAYIKKLIPMSHHRQKKINELSINTQK